MKKFNAQKALAHLLLVGLITTAIFPGTAYAAEVGEQMAEGQQTVMEAVASEKEQQDLVTENADQAQNEPTQENGQTEDAEPSPTVTEYTSADQVLDASTVADEDIGRRLILTADILPEELYGANSVDHYDDLYLLTYENKEACASAYDAFVSAGYVVEKDDLLDAIDPDEIPETKVQDEVTTETIDDLVPTVGTKQTLVAVIDTGISDVANDDVFKNRIIEGTSVISDSYLDDNGHGTAMAKIIAEETADEPDIMILPIKALNENGKGTVLSIALAIKYAKEHGADVINLSLSGVGQSNILTNAINDCYNNGITVVTAAGNDNADAKEYIPGNVDTAINVAAVDKDTDGKIVSATYTNHGDNVDFAALGIYHLSVDKDEVSLETELRGTSIASAHVTAYVAMLKQINAEVSETDVMESLKASATDLGEEGIDPYFGYGFLSKDKLVFKNSENIDDDKKTDVPEIEEDKNTEITTQGGWFYDYWMSTSQEDMITGLFNGATKFVLMNDISFTGTWVIDAGYTFTINGNGHQIINNVPNGGSIITVNGGYLITEGNLTLNGNYHRSGHGVGERTACVDVTGNGTWKGTDTTCCHCWNYGYSGEKNLGGGAGFNIFSQEGTGIFTNCTAYDCDGAGFYIANGELNNCKAYDCSWGVWFSKIGTNVTIKNCDFNANRCDKSKNAGTDDFYGGCGIGSCWWTTANIIDCNISGSNAAVWCGYGGIAKISGSTLHNSDYGIVSDGEVTVSSSTIRSNSQSGTLIKAGTATITNSEIYSNKYGISNNGTVTMNSGDIHNNTAYGVFNSNTFTMNNGSIYSNNYGFYNEGTAYLRGGTIYSNTHDGIRNAGNFNISGGTIKNNKYGIENGFYDEDSILKSGTMNMSGGVIQSNTQDGIYNYSGNATITGGTIKDNQRYGTYNKATMNYAGGASGGNVGYDVYQNGNYKMSGSASTYSNGVYLTKGKMIEITGALTCADGAIKVTVDQRSKDNYLGRDIASCTYGKTKANTDAMLSKFSLQNLYTTSGTKHKAVLRSATGTNGTVGNIILSEEYYVTYDGNVQNAHVTFKLPERQTVYWKEDVDVPTVGTTVYYDSRVFQSLRNVGYSKTADGKGTSCSVGQTMHFGANEITKDQILYAQYTTAADLSINGNTQTAGDNYVIYGFVSNETALPDNTFEKIYSGIEYDENLEKDIPYKTIYSHHGWSYSDQAMYKDSGVGKCGETFDLTPRVLEMINNGQERVSEEGYINNVTLYAVWDEPPKITAKNKYWNTDAIRAGKLNKEDLLRTASAKDKEDGTDVTLEVEDFDIEKFLHLGEYGWMSVRYKATDGAGNVSYKLIKVVVVQSGIVQGEFYDPNPAYVRMIDRENYNKKSHEEGGLMEDSVWYTIPTYKKTILDAFDRLDNGEAIVRYHFSCKDIREAQAFETEAMENGTYPTAAHWEAWLKKFEHCKVFDTGYRSSKELNNSIDPEDYEDYEEPEE